MTVMMKLLRYISNPTPKETAEKELGKIQLIEQQHILDKNPTEQLRKKWNTPIYAFFDAKVVIEKVNGDRIHAFKCGAKHCQGKGKNGQFFQ